MAVNTAGHAVLVNFTRRVVLHHFTFKGESQVSPRAVSFSPCGQYLAVGAGRKLQVFAHAHYLHTVVVMPLISIFRSTIVCEVKVLCLVSLQVNERDAVHITQLWHLPFKGNVGKTFAPLRLLRSHGGFSESLSCVCWSADSRFIAAGK